MEFAARELIDATFERIAARLGRPPLACQLLPLSQRRLFYDDITVLVVFLHPELLDRTKTTGPYPLQSAGSCSCADWIVEFDTEGTRRALAQEGLAMISAVGLAAAVAADWTSTTASAAAAAAAAAASALVAAAAAAEMVSAKRALLPSLGSVARVLGVVNDVMSAGSRLTRLLHPLSSSSSGRGKKRPRSSQSDIDD
eukprot:NODE_2333_length_1228_cov_21.450382_g2127_i0.p1 GENE.NODE_2333_length_1228_cov_21.450382_g2127_i0~~NODE_2333_length_1228_cov_21.450382_g2127_i0.p1  ORF type:complete len:198 (-),score=37.97 NODE_2333_length_1228_cov_21.450382_g2127_i0:197-790(-)